MPGKLSMEGIRLLSDQDLFQLLGTENDEAVAQELKNRGYPDSEIRGGANGGEDVMAEGMAEEEELLKDAEEMSGDPDSAPAADGSLPGPGIEEHPIRKKRFSKKKLIIPGVIAAAAVITACLYFRGYEFRKVENEAVKIAGMATSGKGYFTLDTFPYDNSNMDDAVVALLKDSTQENTLEAIKYANRALGFSSSVYSDMLHTNALMGRQSEENRKYKVSWAYHPDRGLEVTYEKK